MRKYLSNGQEVELIQELNNGFLVSNVYEPPDDESYVGETICFVEKVFDEAPRPKYADSIKELQQHIVKLRKEKTELEGKIANINQSEKERLKKYKQYEQLKHLDNFLDGKITHVLVYEYTPHIVEIKDFKCSYDKKSLKLISLFGESGGNLLWRANQYSDGSGSYDNCMPCLSYDEALEYLQKWIDERVKIDYYGEKINYYGIDKIVKVGTEYDLFVKPEIIEANKTAKINELKRVVDAKQKELGESKEKLAVYETITNTIR